MRKIWIDNLRAGTVVLVFVYHVFYLFNASGVLGGVGQFAQSQYQDAVLCFVYPWFMILLFALAGMSARYSLEKRTRKEFISSRTKKLLAPSTLGLFVFWWILGYFNMWLGGGIEFIPGDGLGRAAIIYLISVLSGIGPLWFAQLLWVYSLFLVFLGQLDIDGKVWKLGERANEVVVLLCGLFLWGGAQVLNAPVITIYRFGVYVVAFLLGYYLLSCGKVQEMLAKWHWPLLATALGMGVGYVAVYFGQNYTEGAVLESVFTNAYAWVATLAAIGCARVWLDRETKVSRWLVSKSWGIYVCHYLPLLAAAWALYQTGLPAPAVYLLTALLGGIGTLGLYGVLRRIPVVKRLVLGE